MTQIQEQDDEEKKIDEQEMSFSEDEEGMYKEQSNDNEDFFYDAKGDEENLQVA
jgi:hypothetical protein